MKAIFLVGYMGSGKSTVGWELARLMNCQFADLDAYIENRYHKTVKELFTCYGEQGFRKIEKRLLEEVCDFQDVVVACGGGTPCYADNMAVMNEKGLTVYLKSPIERLFSRLSLPPARAKRPVIAQKTDEELMQFIIENIKEREVFYRQAHVTIDTTNIETAAETAATAAVLKGMIEPLVKDN